MNDIYAGIDLGTDSIKVVVAQKINDKFYVLAAVDSPSNGIKGGFIEDTKLAVGSIKNALKQVNDLLGIKISKVVACISPSNCSMNIVLGKTNVIDYNEITGTDVSNVLLNAMSEEDFSTLTFHNKSKS